ncbi:pantoate--beta-alanine ligase [bacterium]|nr:pantoate--beta-alanine ligase [bacterium]
MKIIRNAQEMREWSYSQRCAGKKIGFVPTMGFLHEGHLSLMQIAKEKSDTVVVSIFVNPTQFGPGEDYETYPRDEKRDIELLEESAIDILFLPRVKDIYPDEYRTFVSVKGLDSHLCGASRPGHFEGVTTIVSKLLNIVCPDSAVLGSKDAQQARIIQQMTDDLQFGIEIILGAIVREHDGLAMSSRNVRLTQVHRSQASALHRGLRSSRKVIESGERDVNRLKAGIKRHLKENAPDGILEYFEVVDWESMTPIERIDGKVLVAVAVKFGNVRLIDNEILEF